MYLKSNIIHAVYIIGIIKKGILFKLYFDRSDDDDDDDKIVKLFAQKDLF